jgi:type IV secretory pathway TrbD component
MATGRRVNPVYRSISRPLTILGAERKLFFFAMCVGAAVLLAAPPPVLPAALAEVFFHE